LQFAAGLTSRPFQPLVSPWLFCTNEYQPKSYIRKCARKEKGEAGASSHQADFQVLPGHGGIWVVRRFGGDSSVVWGDSSGQRRQLKPNGARQLGSPSPLRAQCVVNRKPNLEGSEPQSLWLSKTRVRARRRRISHATQGHDQIGVCSKIRHAVQ